MNNGNNGGVTPSNVSGEDTGSTNNGKPQKSFSRKKVKVQRGKSYNRFVSNSIQNDAVGGNFIGISLLNQNKQNDVDGPKEMSLVSQFQDNNIKNKLTDFRSFDIQKSINTH